MIISCWWRLVPVAIALLASSDVLAADLQVEVEGIRNKSGQVVIALHGSGKTFPSRWQEAVAVQTLPAGGGRLIASFTNLSPGQYAVIAIHDEDLNGAMTKTFIGLPMEGFGSSNNPAVFGPPRFPAAAFDLRDSAEITIRLVYF